MREARWDCVPQGTVPSLKLGDVFADTFQDANPGDRRLWLADAQRGANLGIEGGPDPAVGEEKDGLGNADA